MAGPGKDYTVGKGRVMFAPFIAGTTTPDMERYLGNTPELNLSADENTLDHFDADSGLNVKDESITIEKTSSGSLVTDNISPENIALFFGGTVDSAAVIAATGLTETKAARKGSWHQLGTSDTNPAGVRKVTNLVVKVGSTTILQPGNYEVDLARGRVFIEDDATDIDESDPVIFTYDVQAGIRKTIVGKGDSVRGALRFISANPVGSQKDFYWPYVKLTSNGDFALKSDEWQQLPFGFEVLKKDATTERVYITIPEAV